MRSRILIFGFVLCLLAAPGLGVAASGSAPCCLEMQDVSEPCGAMGPPCPSMISMPCCDVAPTAPIADGQTIADRLHAEAELLHTALLSFAIDPRPGAYTALRQRADQNAAAHSAHLPFLVVYRV